ncbi:MAG: pyridoxine 5'-phosphate synthase [Gammaproteobacteria bacterium]|nr:pyridoxine 5'-phosphate synthase [Pseudomonadales bacterium]MCP5349161.1 pyridoxine 5'-phosphate synthase [Pseudomonadales bacterium]
MTLLSVNVNKIALLRNSRGRDYPSVTGFVDDCLALGVRGITVHPRPDERHIRRQDVHDLAALLRDRDGVEFNIEGYPSREFLDLVLAVRPAQCTLVPDKPGQLTSDHGWEVGVNLGLLQSVTGELTAAGIRSSLFVDPAEEMIEQVPGTGADRIELYTEEYAKSHGTGRQAEVLERYRQAAACASSLGIGVNAGHDLNLDNLADFLRIPAVLEVSIGHALVVEALYFGIETVIKRYQSIIEAAG